jgi:CBS domain-containing protein
MALHDTLKTITPRNVPGVTATATIQAVIEKMAAAGACAMAVEVNGEVIGVVTDLDLAAALVRGQDPKTTSVVACMTPCDLISGKGAKSPCVQLDEDETVENALKLLDGQGVHNLMVSGPGNHLLGIVSTCTLLRAAVV